jgi:hypothetical protein
MKKLLTLCLLGILSLGTYAQAKPTKQQIIDYLDKALKSAVGYIRYKNDKGDTWRIQNYSFGPSEISSEAKRSNSVTGKTSFNYDQYTNIRWESLKSIEIDKSPSENMDEELTYMFVVFTDKLRYDAQAHGNEVGMSDDMHYPKGFSIYVLRNKAESIKKAMERLAEIAKEENKDPF